MELEEAQKSIVAAERRLLDPLVRSDTTAVEHLLDPQFREIGQSGRLWGRDEMLAALCDPGMSKGLVDAQLSEVVVEQLADDLYLLTYLLAVDTRVSRRSSIWRLGGSGPRLVFHQGTAVVAS